MRLGMLYAITDEELKQLLEQPEEERYDYMLNEIEEVLFNTPRACELNKAWDGIQYCLGAGIWNEENKLPYNVIVGGEPLVYMGDDAGEILTLKRLPQVEEIAGYLQQHNLSEIIQNNHDKINEEEYYFTVDEENLEFLLSSCGEIQKFYEHAAKEGCHVIFSVDI